MDIRVEQPEIAFYYPDPVWHSGYWVKNLILFFDGIGLLVPSYLKDKPERIDPAIVAGLKQHGLLHILEPETLVDKAATEKLAKILTDIITSGALDSLREQKTAFDELSYSRLGSYGDEGLANMIFEELKARGLAKDSQDGESIPMHPTVRSLVLVLLAQILRPYGQKLGMRLSPATDRPQMADALGELLSLPMAASAGHVVSFDLETVGVDLGSVPIDEVLGFRREHFVEFQAYARSIRRFVAELSPLPEEERGILFEERQNELVERARELKRISRQAWKRPALFALSLAGATWTLKTGDPIGAAVSTGSVLLGLGSGEEVKVDTYSYIFSAQNRFSY